MSSKEDLNRQIRALEADKAALAREYWAAKLGAESLLKTVITQSRQIAALQEQLAKRRCGGGCGDGSGRESRARAVSSPVRQGLSQRSQLWARLALSHRRRSRNQTKETENDD